MSIINNISKTGKNAIVNAVSVDLGCSLSCLKPKKLLSSFFRPKPRLNSHHRSNCSPFLSRSFSSSHNLTATTTTASASASSFSPPSYPCSQQNLLESEADLNSKPMKGFGRIDGEGVAVERDSRDPYLDFRHSMLQMIIENEIYSRDDLRELLSCFLQLNSPCYHGVIVRAFTEIWNPWGLATSPQRPHIMGTCRPGVIISPDPDNNNHLLGDAPSIETQSTLMNSTT